MKPLQKISRIIAVEPFKITLLWNTSEIRALDFAQLCNQWEADGDSKMAALRDWETFKQVTLSENRTLCWPNVLVSFSFKGGSQYNKPLGIRRAGIVPPKHFGQKNRIGQRGCNASESEGKCWAIPSRCRLEKWHNP